MAATQQDITLKILRDVHDLYVDPSVVNNALGRKGLEDISKEVGFEPSLLPPRKRITVMIIGNHSAGKSSFINWYVEEKVQKTGVAVETQGFTVIRSGVRSQDIRGEGALVDNKQLAALADRLGKDRHEFIENLQLLVRPSKAKNFREIDLIDTPGLVDGNIQYPFDVNGVIVQLAAMCDLILVFLDPIGQALCSRTMNVVKELNEKGYADRCRYYLTKADTVASREDLNKVLVQVTTNLSLRVKNTHGFDVPQIWIPREDREESGGYGSGGRKQKLPAVSDEDDADGMNAGDVKSTPAKGAGAMATPPYQSPAAGVVDRNDGNSLFRLCDEVSRTIAQKVQKNMADCISDCKKLNVHIEHELDSEKGKAVRASKYGRYKVALWALIFPLLGGVTFLDIIMVLEPSLPSALRNDAWFGSVLAYAATPMQHLFTLFSIAGFATVTQRLLALAVMLLFFSLMIQVFNCRTSGLRRRGRDEIRNLNEYQGKVDAMRYRVGTLQEDYVRSSQTPEYDGIINNSNSGSNGGGSAVKRVGSERKK